MRILLTGADGFIGRALAARARRAAIEVIPLAGDIEQIAGVPGSVDAIVHLAAIAAPGPAAPADVGEIFRVNVGGTLAVAAHAQQHRLAVVFASTAGVYRPPLPARPLREDDPLGPPGCNGASKLAAEAVLRHASARWQLPVTILRIFNPYGPGQPPPFLVPDALASLRAGRPVALRSPEAVRDLVHVDDVAAAFLLAVRTAPPPGTAAVYNVGSGTGTRVCDLVQRLAALVGSTPPFIAAAAESERATTVVADCSRIRSALGWQPQRALETSLAELAAAPVSRS